MSSLTDRRVVVGVTGSVAAYKAAELTRLLRKSGCETQVVMTPAALEFITPMTLQAVSGRPVREQLMDADAEASMGHIELARWADAVVVAPASADFIAHLAGGRADNLLLALCLAAETPPLLAPAMNQAMWRNPATQSNCALLVERGATLIGPAEGDQACGDVGPGRMSEPADIVAALQEHLGGGRLSGVRALINAGPTREALDATRFISNRSSGRMGFALAQAMAAAGASVTLISGPVSLPTPDRVRRVDVESAEEMRDATLQALPADIFVGVAAVADYRGDAVGEGKLSREDQGERWNLSLVRNPDIAAAVAASPKRPRLVVGFAAESGADVQGGADKLRRKGLDLICVNDISRDDVGFDSEDNEIVALWDGGRLKLPRASKSKLASRLVELFAERLQA